MSLSPIEKPSFYIVYGFNGAGAFRLEMFWAQVAIAALLQFIHDGGATIGYIEGICSGRLRMRIG